MSTSNNHIKNIISDSSAEVILIARRSCYERPLFLSMGAANKQGAHRMVKELAMWNQNVDSIFTLTIDDDDCVGKNIKTAEAVDHSLQKLTVIDLRPSSKLMM